MIVDHFVNKSLEVFYVFSCFVVLQQMYVHFYTATNQWCGSGFVDPDPYGEIQVQIQEILYSVQYMV